ncbi:MAG: hypothetical protein M3P70_11565 [Actinomycetota bacterium]|nr:hypothetical protein [Actinomycetota bacterium]
MASSTAFVNDKTRPLSRSPSRPAVHLSGPPPLRHRGDARVHPPQDRGVTSDFNCRPGSPPYQVFEEAGFTDTFRAAGNEDADGVYTFHAFRGKHLSPGDTDKPTGRIDWILTRDDAGQITVRSHEILRDGDEETGRYPSDHYPVLAELELCG